jgi:hypothetical protein
VLCHVQITDCSHPLFQCWITGIEIFIDDHFPFNNAFRTRQRISHRALVSMLWPQSVFPWLTRFRQEPNSPSPFFMATLLPGSLKKCHLICKPHPDYRYDVWTTPVPIEAGHWSNGWRNTSNRSLATLPKLDPHGLLCVWKAKGYLSQARIRQNSTERFPSAITVVTDSIDQAELESVGDAWVWVNASRWQVSTLPKGNRKSL